MALQVQFVFEGWFELVFVFYSKDPNKTIFEVYCSGRRHRLVSARCCTLVGPGRRCLERERIFLREIKNVGWPAGQVTSSTSYPERNLFGAFLRPTIAPHRVDGWVTGSHSRLIPAETHLRFSLIVSLIESQQISPEFFPMQKKL